MFFSLPWGCIDAWTLDRIEALVSNNVGHVSWEKNISLENKPEADLSNLNILPLSSLKGLSV